MLSLALTALLATPAVLALPADISTEGHQVPDIVGGTTAASGELRQSHT